MFRLFSSLPEDEDKCLPAPRRVFSSPFIPRVLLYFIDNGITVIFFSQIQLSLSIPAAAHAHLRTETRTFLVARAQCRGVTTADTQFVLDPTCK